LFRSSCDTSKKQISKTTAERNNIGQRLRLLLKGQGLRVKWSPTLGADPCAASRHENPFATYDCTRRGSAVESSAADEYSSRPCEKRYPYRDSSRDEDEISSSKGSPENERNVEKDQS